MMPNLSGVVLKLSGDFDNIRLIIGCRLSLTKFLHSVDVR
jgi:hypothetical protein